MYRLWLGLWRLGICVKWELGPARAKTPEVLPSPDVVFHDLTALPNSAVGPTRANVPAAGLGRSAAARAQHCAPSAGAW